MWTVILYMCAAVAVPGNWNGPECRPMQVWTTESVRQVDYIRRQCEDAAAALRRQQLDARCKL